MLQQKPTNGVRLPIVQVVAFTRIDKKLCGALNAHCLCHTSECR